MNEANQVTLKIGTKGFFENYTVDTFEIIQPTLVTVTQMGGNKFWYRSVGHVKGFPVGHPDLLINYKDIEKCLSENE